MRTLEELLQVCAWTDRAGTIDELLEKVRQAVETEAQKLKAAVLSQTAMNPAQQRFLILMEVFDRIDSTARQIGNEEQALAWRPANGREQQAFEALISADNRPALREWYASVAAINPHADHFRRILERATGDCFPVGKRALNLEESRKLVANGSENWPRLVDAAATVCHSPESSFEDLLACLAHRGLPSEFAAMKLYTRTKRPRADDTIESFVMDRQEWTEYLKSHGLP